MFKKLSSRPKTFIAIIVILMSITSMEYFPVSIMEARNFITAREMVQDQNWLLTTMNGEARYEKPPFPTWLSAISGSIFGMENSLALRLPAILMLMITGIFGYLISLKLLKHRAKAFINALLIITSFYVLGIVVEAPWDIYAHGLMLIGLYYILNLLRSESVNIKHILLASLFIGLSILSKGPVSLYALMIPFLIAYLISYRNTYSSKKIGLLFIIIVLSIIIGGWWYLYVRLVDPEVFNSITSKETQNWGSYNVRPFYYYWSFFIQSGIWTIPALISLLYPYLKNKVENLQAYQFTILWTLISVVMLSLIPEKKSRYLVPVLIPLALNTGFYIDYLRREFRTIKSYLELAPIYINFGLLLIVCFVIPISVFYMKDFFVGFSVIWYTFFTFGLLISGLAIFFGLKSKNAKTLFLSAVGIMVNIFLFLPPIYNKMDKNEYKSIRTIHKNEQLNELDVYALERVSPEMIWEYGDKIPILKEESGNVNFPAIEKFSLLVDPNSENIEQILSQGGYSYKKITTFNLNRSSKDSKSYRDRLVNDLYLVSSL